MRPGKSPTSGIRRWLESHASPLFIVRPARTLGPRAVHRLNQVDFAVHVEVENVDIQPVVPEVGDRAHRHQYRTSFPSSSFVHYRLRQRAALARVDDGALELCLAARFEESVARLDLCRVFCDPDIRRRGQRRDLVRFYRREIVRRDGFEPFSRAGLRLRRS